MNMYDDFSLENYSDYLIRPIHAFFIMMLLAISILNISVDINQPKYFPTLNFPELPKIQTIQVESISYYAEPMCLRENDIRTKFDLNMTYSSATSPSENVLESETDIVLTEDTISIEPSPVPLSQHSYSINQKSNLSAEQFDNLINKIVAEYGFDQSKLIGLGNALYQMEETYNVNGLFALSVAVLESGHGNSELAQYRNNIFGLNGGNGYMHFSSVEDCVLYWGNLMNHRYIADGLTTISLVSSRYCPPTHIEWTGAITTFYEKYQNYALSS